jgi:ClpP class serine protease
MALKEGLVDKLGGLKEAYDLAIEKAGLDPKEVQPVILPRQKSIFEALFAPQAAAAAALDSQPLPEALRGKLPLLQILKLFEHESILTVMPYGLEIE